MYDLFLFYTLFYKCYKLDRPRPCLHKIADFHRQLRLKKLYLIECSQRIRQQRKTLTRKTHHRYLIIQYTLMRSTVNVTYCIEIPKMLFIVFI